MLSKSMYKTVLQQTYERYVNFAKEERDLAAWHRVNGDIKNADFFDERANDFARQATNAMRDIERMR